MTPLEGLQQALAGEHAATYVYGLLGAQASASRQPGLFSRLDRAYQAHRAQRDELTELVTAQGATPVAAEPVYDPPGPVSGAKAIGATALVVERRLTRLYADLVAATAAEERRWAIAALEASALRELDFGGAPADLPGLT